MSAPGADYEYDDLVSRAESIRSRIPGHAITGSGMPSGISPEALGYTASEEGLHPFIGIRNADAHTTLMIPAATDEPNPDRTAAIRILKLLDARFLAIAGCCTALRARIPEHAVVLIADHINLSGYNPLAGRNDDRIGPRFSSMTEPYDLRLLDRAERSALEGGLTVQRCVFAGVGAPPTWAECRFLAYTGADVYGFGITSDTITAAHAGLPVIAAADVITRRIPEGPVTHDTAKADTSALSDNLTGLLERLIQ